MILKIKTKLQDNEDLIINILENIGCSKIHKVKQNEIRFGIDEYSSGSANSLFIDTLYYKSFSRGKNGDILTLVAEVKGITLGDSIRWCAKELGIKEEYSNIKVTLPFEGFFKNYSKTKEIDETPPTIYPLERLNDYDQGLSLMWVQDGISLLTQEEFNIGYDLVTNRITIPWLSEYGDLIGIMGRLHTQDVKDYQNKYLPIIAFNKSKALYGYYQNYRGILESGVIVICESEKSVLKAREIGYKNVVALGGNNISKIHERLIKSMYCNVIVAFDEGLSLAHCMEQAKKLIISNPFINNEVYVLDMEGLDKKSCIFDLNKGTVNKAFEERLIYVGE